MRTPIDLYVYLNGEANLLMGQPAEATRPVHLTQRELRYLKRILLSHQPSGQWHDADAEPQ